ncbi:MAG TPA: tetratricopeptide repeat protein [Azospirillum sp.]|nr:tetratricopeptide repeat protein [Azospirillum sp.]
MSDIFQEVDEDLRRDRTTQFMKRYGGLLGTVAVLLVAATAGWQAWQGWKRSQAEAETGRLVSALSQAAAGPQKGIEALTAFSGSAPASLAVLARLNEAALRVEEGKTAEAVALYDSIAGNGSADAIYRDLATLLSVMHQMDGGDAAKLQTRLQPLTVDASPWRFSARELTALLAARSGDRERARSLFQQLADDSLAPSGVRSRAADLAALYGKS